MKAKSTAGLSSFEFKGTKYSLHSILNKKNKRGETADRLPYSLKILLENLLRNLDDVHVLAKDIDALLEWDPQAEPNVEIQFTPSRVLLQDFTGVPVVADLAAMRAEIDRRGGQTTKINPIKPVDLVIDHSVQVDSYGSNHAVQDNARLEFERNGERYTFLKWGQKNFSQFRVVPPATGICHQVNLEFLSPLVQKDDTQTLFPDTVVGTDSHTPMINGLGVLGWGVGGIEAEAAMLGQPCSILIPQVVGVKLTGNLKPGTTATDLVLTITQMLRKFGVVGKFVEFYGPGVSTLSIAERATVSNMSPEYGSTVGLFPVDDATMKYMHLTGRSDQAELAQAYLKEQGMWFDPAATPRYSAFLELDLGKVETSVAGPAKPHDRSPLSKAGESFRGFLHSQLSPTYGEMSKKPLERWLGEGGGSTTDPKNEGATDERIFQEIHRSHLIDDPSQKTDPGKSFSIGHGSIVIAAITSCTNTSNPEVMIGAGLLARNAVRKGLTVKPWVKTSFAPGSLAVTEYLRKANLLGDLEKLNFNIVGYGCTTCIGNSGPLPVKIAEAIEKEKIVTASVLSGNRNFEARIHPLIAANYLMSPPLVVAYAIAGDININLTTAPLGNDSQGKPVYLKDIWPEAEEIQKIWTESVQPEAFKKVYANVFAGNEEWQGIPIPKESVFQFDQASTYIQEPPFPALKPLTASIKDARVLAMFGDFITTDHISPAGSISENSPAGKYLKEKGVAPIDFNSYGSRRGNHQVMVRGTFANVRIKNLMTPEKVGGFTKHMPDQKLMTIYEAAELYKTSKTPLVVIAGLDYGSGSSRDWAAKGVNLLGVRAVIARSFERIHRSNLVGMGVAPLQFKDGESAQTLALTGEETLEILGLENAKPQQSIKVRITSKDGQSKEIEASLRIDTPGEMNYFRSGGILPYVLNQLASS